jgi:hypothetical protein
MVKERIFEFSLPTYKQIFTQENFSETPYCLCYQYDINDVGRGPYGFNTANSRKIIHSVFENLRYWNKKYSQFIDHTEIKKDGLYTYGDNSFFIKQQEYVNNYSLALKKKELLSKKGLTHSLPQIPILSYLWKESLIDTSAVNLILKDSMQFFILDFFAPEAGKTLILFDKSIKKRIKEASALVNIDFYTVNQINDLPAW